MTETVFVAAVLGAGGLVMTGAFVVIIEVAKRLV